MEKLKNAVSRIWEKILWRLHLVPRRYYLYAQETADQLVTELNEIKYLLADEQIRNAKLKDELAAWRDAPAAARETRQIVPIRMQAKLYGFEEEGYFPEQALQEIHNAKREFLAREIGQAMLDKGLLKVRIQRDPFLQQVEMELHAEVLE